MRALVLVALVACAHGPRMYAVPAPPLDDDAGFARLAGQLRADYEHDLALTPAVSHAAIAELVGSAREVPLDTAEAIVFQRWFVQHVAPRAADYEAVLSRELPRRTSGSSPPGTPGPSGSPAAATGDR